MHTRCNLIYLILNIVKKYEGGFERFELEPIFKINMS